VKWGDEESEAAHTVQTYFAGGSSKGMTQYQIDVAEELNIGPDIAFPAIGDCIHIAESGDYGILVLEILSLTEKSGDNYLTLLKGLPHIGSNLKLVRSERKHSSQVVCDLIPPALHAWTRSDEAVSSVPAHVLDTLKSAKESTFFASKEVIRVGVHLPSHRGPLKICLFSGQNQS
jgi:hypothetical protein